MAKPIEPTPTLRGKDAERFIKQMIKEEKNFDFERFKILERARKKRFRVIIDNQEIVI